MADSVIRVGMDVGDVKAAGVELLNILQGQVDATLRLAEAQIKYNKEGKEVATVLKGLNEDGDKYTVTLKKTAAGYELVNAQVNKSKAALAEVTAQQKLAAEASRAEQKAIEDKAREYKRLADLMSSSSATSRKDVIAGMSFSGREAAASGGAAKPPEAPPPGYYDSLFGGTEKATRAGERLFITWQGIVRLIEAQVIKRVINEIGNAFVQAVDSARKFSIQVAEIRTISQDAPLTTGRWREEITKLSSAFGQTQADVASAAYETLSNQVAKGPEVFDFLASAMKFGAATVSSTTDSVNLLSSALKSFNIPVEQTERVAAIFFKTIDLGRVRAKEMADTFGRVGAIANQVGVKLEEVAAAIATITVRGVRFADASTIITNVLSKMIKPTEQMKELFTEWGVASGDAAIQTFGFEGVLAKLNEESKKGSSRIGELFNQIKSLRGAFQLSGQGFADYQENLRKITTAQGQYNIAAKEVLTSPGKQLDIAMTKIKNLFTEDFGQAAVAFLAGLNKQLESSTDAADGLVRMVKLVVKGLTAGAVVLATIKLLTIANITSTTTWAAAWSMVGVSANAAAINMLKALPLLAAFAAGYAIGEVLQNNGSQSSDEIVAEIRKKNDAKREAEKRYRDANGDKEVETTVALKNALDLRYQFALSYSTGVVRLAEEVKKRSIDQYKDITDAVKITSRTYFDSIALKMSDLKKSVSEAERLIKASFKYSEDLPRRTGATIFETRMKHASEGQVDDSSGAPQIIGNQKIQLLENRISVLLAEARLKAQSGTKETFEESRKLYDDVQKLQAQLFEAKTSVQKRTFDERVRLGQENPSGFSQDPLTGKLKPQFDFLVRTVDYEKTLNELQAERLGNEAKFRKFQEDRSLAAEAEIAREKERLRLLQQAFTAIEKIDIFNKEGKVKDEFKKDPGRVTRQFDEQADKIRALAGPEAFGTQFQVFNDLQRQRLALVEQVQAAIRAEEAKTSQEGIARSKRESAVLVDAAGASMTRGREAIASGLNRLEEDLGVIEGRSLRLQSLFKIPGTNTEVFSKNAGYNRSEPKRQEALQVLKEVKEASKAFAEDQSSDKLQVLKDKIEALKLATAQYLQLLTGKDPANLQDKGDTLTQGQRLKGLDTGVNIAAGGATRQAEARQQLMDALDQVDKLDGKLRGLPGATEFFSNKLTEVAPVVRDSFATFSDGALQLTNQITRLNEQLQTAASLLPQIRGNREMGPPPNVEQKFFGGPPKAKYFSFGGPVGPDRIPAWLAEDEYVMTGAATRAFNPLLKAMNSYPSRAMGSGGSVTNVGDITVNVHGGNSSAATVNEIGMGLRRAIARGTVKLDK